MNKNEIRQLRVRAGVSITQALEQLNISYSMLSKLERSDRLPGKDLITKMSELYGCSIDEIYKAFDLNKTSKLMEAEMGKEKRLINSMPSKADLEAMRFRKRSIIGGLKNVDYKLMENLMKNENLLIGKREFQKFTQLEEKFRQFSAINAANIQLMLEKRELELELEKTNDSLNFCEICSQTKVAGFDTFYSADKDKVIN